MNNPRELVHSLHKPSNLGYCPQCEPTKGVVDADMPSDSTDLNRKLRSLLPPIDEEVFIEAMQLIEADKASCDAVPNEQPNDVHLKYFNAGYKKGMADKAAAVQETAKAYGGCTKCYGKGYATVRDGQIAFADFYGDKTHKTSITNRMKFCTCGRGKQLAQLQGGKSDE